MFAARAALATVLLAAPAAGRASDQALEARLNAALAADPRLGGLTVSVVDRVAVVGGPVPDAAAKAAAERIVRDTPGPTAVRLGVWVPLAADPFVTRAATGRPPPPPAPKPPPPVPAGDGPPLALPLPGHVAPPAPVVPPAPEPVTAERRADRRGRLGPPVAGDAGTIPPPGVPPLPPARFATLTAADPRFRRLTVDLSAGGTATIGGTGDPAAAWDLAAAVRRQPGVTRVIVGPVRER